MPRDEPRFREQHLSVQEAQVLVKMAEGLRDSDIAADLGKNVQVIRAIAERIRGKTGATSRPQMVAYAYEHGYVVPAYLQQYASPKSHSAG